MSKKKKEPKIKVLRKRGRTLKVRFDYGKELSINFPTDRTDEEIVEELEALYKEHKTPKKIVIPEEIDFEE